MKSLEIVNERIECFKDILNNTECNELERAIYQERLEEYQQIKQDLEVLEIFKKNIITIQSEPDSDYGGFHDDMFEIIIDRSFKTEDFHKVKQWLEEN